MTPELFIGLVTHGRTRYPEASSEAGLAHSLAARFEDRDAACSVRVFGEDAWTPELLLVDASEIERSIDAELDAEARWRKFQSPRLPGALVAGFMAVRRIHRRRKFLPSRAPLDETHPGFRMVRRLVNIEVAHLTLLQEARDASAAWALILEDDATADGVEAATTLQQVMEAARATHQPAYVNVSRSFTEDRLRVEGHLTEIGTLPGSGPAVQILSSSQPITNTVCAVLYRGSFLAGLLAALDSIPLSPVIPIDWKLNMALMAMFRDGQLGPGDCWSLRPAPILQGSMHS